MDKDKELFLSRMSHLYALAQEDEVFNMWKERWVQSAESFERFARWMPKSIRKMLYTYADGGRTMMQRMNTIACMHMEFTGKPLAVFDTSEKKGSHIIRFCVRQKHK